MRDLGNNLKAEQHIAPAVLNADVNDTTPVDLQGFEGAAVVINTGIEGVTFGAGVHIRFKLLHSDTTTNTDFVAVTQADVTDAQVFNGDGSILFLDDNAETPQVLLAGYIGGKRYLQVEIDFTGSHSTGTPMAVSVIKGYARHAQGASTYAPA